MIKSSKIIIVSGTSGSGKTTLVNSLIQHDELNLVFSVSACSRARRPLEKNGSQYIFLSLKEFKNKIKMGEFLEWEEVYPNHFYGTLKSSCDKLLIKGHNILFDVDIKGALSIKNYFKNQARSIFVQPSDIEIAKERLINRNTESAENLTHRIKKMKQEVILGKQLDYQLINDDLDCAKSSIYNYGKSFLLL